MQKPCRHLAAISLGKLSDRLTSSSPLTSNLCNSCPKETISASPVFSCLTCLQSFCREHLNQHSRERNHPISFNLNFNESSQSENIEKYFYCSLCSNYPKISEPGKKERVHLEKVKGFFMENQQKVDVIISLSNPPTPSESQNIKIVPKGISNLGNTCFMNSAMQLLAATFKRHGPLKTSSSSPIWNSLIHHSEEIYSSFTGEIKKKKHAAASNNNNTLNPREFLGLLCGKQKKFASMQQQDAHDFLRLLFNSVTEAPQIELFGGKFVSRVVCERCKKVSDTNEPFLDISLALPDETSLSEALSKLDVNHTSSSSKSGDSGDSSSDAEISFNSYNQNVSIDILLKNWNKKITLKGENGYYCDSCSPQDTQILQTASLQFFLIDPLPPFLILHLQRFKTQISRNTGGGRKSKGAGGMCLTIEKDDRTIVFPLNLKIASTLCSKDTNYRLYGYIIHEGSSTSCGHYTAVVSTSNDSWFYISDARVKEISKSRALDAETYTPYLLFYQQI